MTEFVNSMKPAAASQQLPLSSPMQHCLKSHFNLHWAQWNSLISCHRASQDVFILGRAVQGKMLKNDSTILVKCCAQLRAVFITIKYITSKTNQNLVFLSQALMTDGVLLSTPLPLPFKPWVPFPLVFFTLVSMSSRYPFGFMVCQRQKSSPGKISECITTREIFFCHINSMMLLSHAMHKRKRGFQSQTRTCHFKSKLSVPFQFVSRKCRVCVHRNNVPFTPSLPLNRNSAGSYIFEKVDNFQDRDTRARTQIVALWRDNHK